MAIIKEIPASYYVKEALESVEYHEKRFELLWEAVKPKVGEVWTKRGCSNPACGMGWSFGVRSNVEIKDDKNDYGGPHHLICGCLHKVK